MKLRHINSILGFVSVQITFLLVAIICIDVVGRNLFKAPLPAVNEFVTYGLVAIVFLGLSYAQQEKSHPRVDVLLSRFSPAANVWLDLLANLLAVCLFSLIARQGWIAFLESVSNLEYWQAHIQVPIYPLRFVLVFGSLLFCVQHIAEAIANVSRLKQHIKKKQIQELP